MVAFFGLGAQELIIIAGLATVLFVGVGIAIYLATASKSNEE